MSHDELVNDFGLLNQPRFFLLKLDQTVSNLALQGLVTVHNRCVTIGG
jgi:hypothetical protein